MLHERSLALASEGSLLIRLLVLSGLQSDIVPASAAAGTENQNGGRHYDARDHANRAQGYVPWQVHEHATQHRDVGR